jgi:hypothetical protein
LLLIPPWGFANEGNLGSLGTDPRDDDVWHGRGSLEVDMGEEMEGQDGPEEEEENDGSDGDQELFTHFTSFHPRHPQ